MRASKEEIEKYLSEIRSHIDYEVGDWVEVDGKVVMFPIDMNDKKDVGTATFEA